ncbi:MAG: TM2 domain-containing protein [Cyanobacteria bacterium]|jgi:TM2 domain-containing membrane protein YozV|nr:TM2 domain-containing protein [Cyanobacteriota bacterium]MDA0866747.1 TM2 domain-containing protein [Cyanobacteriota bacterium]
MTAASSDQKRLVTAYILWLAGFFGFSGLHRLYNGKIVSGLFWFCTLGIFGVGQFIDVFLVPGMTEEHQLKLRAKYGFGPYGIPSPQTSSSETIAAPSPEEKRIKLLTAASKHQGQLSVTQAVMETGMGFEESEVLLRDMVRQGYVAVDNHPQTGVVIYRFDELVS